MKTSIITLLLVLVPFLVLADTLTLTNPEEISIPSATTMDWRIDRIDAESRTVTVKYRWLDEDGRVIAFGTRQRAGWNEWECSDTCFTDVFGFVIRTQDAGTKIGEGLRLLIWNKFRADVLPANNGSFD